MSLYAQPENLDEDKQKRSSGGSDLTDIGHAHIRSYTDSSQQGAGGDMDARDLRNARLARGAVYRVTATLKCVMGWHWIWVL